MIGKVSFWSRQKGYGFIVRNDRLEDLFFHVSEVDNPDDLKQWDMVAFDVGYFRGRSVAVKVRCIGVDNESAPVVVRGGNSNGDE